MEIVGIMVDGFAKKPEGFSIPLYYQLKYGICTEADREPTVPIPLGQLRQFFVISEGDADHDIPPRTAKVNLTIGSKTFLQTSVLYMLGASYKLAHGERGITILAQEEYIVKLLWGRRVPFDSAQFNYKDVFVRMYLSGTLERNDETTPGT